MIRIFEAFTGRRIAATVQPDPAEAGEVAALTTRLAASEAAVRDLLVKLAERDKELRTVEEDLVRLRAANVDLAERVNRPSPWHPRVEVAPRDPDEALKRRAEQDRRNAVELERRLAIAEGRA